MLQEPSCQDIQKYADYDRLASRLTPAADPETINKIVQESSSQSEGRAKGENQNTKHPYSREFLIATAHRTIIAHGALICMVR